MKVLDPKFMVKTPVKLLLLLVVSALAFSSCEDEDSVENAMIGRVWAGDVGLNADNMAPLYSVFEFGADGFGTESQYYQSNDFPYKQFRFQWYWESGYDRNLVLDYGNFGISYMDNVYISGFYMTGIFYFDSQSEGFEFSLDMQ